MSVRVPGSTKIKEKDITKQIRDYLNAKGIFHYKVWQGLGSAKGVPDIAGVLKGGRALYIEIKTPKGVVSEYQQDFINRVTELGGLVFVARCVEDVMKAGI